jgi:hypothetical protein
MSKAPGIGLEPDLTLSVYSVQRHYEAGTQERFSHCLRNITSG